VTSIENEAQWKELVLDSAKPVVVDFSAAWCGPCRMIAPFFEELSLKYENVVFVKIDVDEVEAVVAQLGIEAMPTFHIWKSGIKQEELVGASKDKLESMIKKYN